MGSIYVAGHRGLVGSAICRRLQNEGAALVTATRDQVNLKSRSDVDAFFAGNEIEQVYLAAAKVGGIYANDNYPADFLYDNIAIQMHVIDAAWRAGVKKLLFLGSSCIYPKHAPQPMTEDCLLTGPLEPTNEWYAVAKIAGIKLCQAYRKQHGFDAISVMPTNLYGPGDNFDLRTSHVLPALIRKFHEAKISGEGSVTLWGTGTPRREFLHVDDLADACVFIMENYSAPEIVNVGWGQDVTILELAEIVKEVVGYDGDIELDKSKPDGTPRKLLDTSRLTSLGWKPSIGLKEGICGTLDWYAKNVHH